MSLRYSPQGAIHYKSLLIGHIVTLTKNGSNLINRLRAELVTASACDARSGCLPVAPVDTPVQQRAVYCSNWFRHAHLAQCCAHEEYMSWLNLTQKSAQRFTNPCCADFKIVVKTAMREICWANKIL